jgi:alkylation response protein AidB-like acyl-CoA dehydrogenase
MAAPATSAPTAPAENPSAPPSLEPLLGDPFDATNPTGHDAVLAADDRGQPLAAGEAVLDRWGANAEYVPVALGGRLGGVDELVRRLRPVFRRDAGLGLGHGLTSLMAALPVWAAGDDRQRERLTTLLLGGERVCVAFHELAHGNDLSGNELRARTAPPGLRLDGTKQVINNTGQAAAALVFARTGTRTGREHSLLLLDDLRTLPARSFTRLPRFRTAGLAGCQLGGLHFTDCPVPESAVVGRPGDGVAVALRAFQVSRCVTAGVGTALLEASLFAVLHFATHRRLYGRTVADIPHARSLLAGAFTDLQVAQALAHGAARSLHLHPEVAGRYAAAAKYLVPRFVEDALGDLAVVLGARSYLREGPYAVVGKHLRDIAGLSIGHAGGLSCQLTLLPELAGLDPTHAPAHEAVFTDTPLPALDLAALRLRGGRADPLLATLTSRLDELGPLGDTTRAELAAFRAAAAVLPPAERGITASPRTLQLTDRYAWLLAAACCVGVHDAAARTGAPPGAPEWLHRALYRIAHRSRRPAVPAAPHADDAVLAELTARAAAETSLDLHPEPVTRPAL